MENQSNIKKLKELEKVLENYKEIGNLLLELSKTVELKKQIVIIDINGKKFKLKRETINKMNDIFGAFSILLIQFRMRDRLQKEISEARQVVHDGITD